MRFQVGDVVRISRHFTDLEGEAIYPSGRNGEVVQIRDRGGYPIKVLFDDVGYGAISDEYSEFKEEELKLVRRNL